MEKLPQQRHHIIRFIFDVPWSSYTFTRVSYSDVLAESNVLLIGRPSIRSHILWLGSASKGPGEHGLIATHISIIYEDPTRNELS